MASTMAEVAAGQIMLTDQCLEEIFDGHFDATAIQLADRYKLVLLNLAAGALTLTQADTKFWSQLSDAETNVKSDGVTAGPVAYTKGTGISLTGASRTVISAHEKALDFSDVSLDNADFRTDAYAIVRATGNLATSPVLALGKWAGGAKTPSGTGTANFTATMTNTIKFKVNAPA